MPPKAQQRHARRKHGVDVPGCYTAAEPHNEGTYCLSGKGTGAHATKHHPAFNKRFKATDARAQEA